MNDADREAARVPMSRIEPGPSNNRRAAGRGADTFEPAINGRWPANLIHDGSDEVVAAFPRTETHATGNGGARKDTGSTVYGGFTGEVDAGRVYGSSSGSAARFFYCAKTTRRDRDEGLADHLPRARRARKRRQQDLSGRFAARARNAHPTVKPTALMRYLCRLVTPPGGLVLDPFCGSGSTGKAALREGFRFLGIDQDRAFVALAQARLAHALATAPVASPAGARSLFD
jgi:site-specific DNA-methyltransferase (adenine-specific)